MVNLAVQNVQGTEVVRGEVIGIDLTRAQIAAVVQRGYTIVASQALGQLDVSYTRFGVPEGVSESQAAATLNSQVAPDRFDFNHAYRLTQAACTGERCNGRRLVRWPVDQTERCPVEVRVGMIDTGVSPQASGVPRSRLVTRSFHGGSQRSATAHGSAVAALLAGSNHLVPGLLPYSRLYAADVFALLEDGRQVTSAAMIANGIDWLANFGVEVINVSLAGPANRLLQRAVERAAARGVSLVASVGNDGPRARPAFPAAYPQVLAVTAVDTRRRLYPQAVRGQHVSLAAPGVAVYAPTEGGGSYHTGTSFAAPFVTASVAVLRAQGTTDAPLIQTALQQTAADLGARGRDPMFGWGLLSAPAKCR